MATEELKGAYNFLIEVDGVTAGYFKSVDGLSARTEVVERREVRFGSGVAVTDGLWTWRRAVASRRAVPMTVVVKKYDRGGRVEAEWVLSDATIAQFQAPDFGRAGAVTPIAGIVLEAKPTVTLNNVGRRFGGSYYVNSTSHRI